MQIRLDKLISHPIDSGITLSRDAAKRLEWISHYIQRGRNAAFTSRHFGISRQTFYRWWRRYDPRNFATLESRSRRPHHPWRPSRSAQLVDRVVALRSHYPSRDNNVGCRPMFPGQVTPTKHNVGVRNSQATNFLPPFIELSPVQREILDLIITHKTSIKTSIKSERAILLWNEGVSYFATAKEIGVSEDDVRILRNCWLRSSSRINAAEKKLLNTFNHLMSLIFQFPNEVCSASVKPHSLPHEAEHSSISQRNSNEIAELRPATRAVIEILHHKPKVYGINRSNWTQESVAEAFGKLFDWRPSKTTVCRLLKTAGLSWKKSRRVLTSPDPSYREKVELLLRTLHALRSDEELFFVDELGPLQIRRYGGRCYTPKGQTPTYPQKQHSKGSITVYGALSATTNQVTWFYGNSKDSVGMINLAEILFNQYHNKLKIYLTWDAASWHRSNALVEWIDNLNVWNSANDYGPIIEFVPLPSSAQFLDVIEAVFSAMKRAVIHHSDYQSEEEMKIAISTHFRERNEFFIQNPKRVGKKMWDIDFFRDLNHIRSGNYREW